MSSTLVDVNRHFTHCTRTMRRHTRVLTLSADLARHQWTDPGPDGRYPSNFPPLTATTATADSATAPPRTLNAGVFSTCGARGPDKMEDRHVVVRNLNGIEGAHLVGVFDGGEG